jgi:predicted dehydrogenase
MRKKSDTEAMREKKLDVGCRKGTPTRRSFLQAMIATATAPIVLPSSVFGQHAPSKRLNIGMIGMGRQAYQVNLPPFLFADEVKVLAVCDVDQWRLDNAKQKVDGHYKTKDCRASRDWRELVQAKDIDVIINSTSDQWHVPISLAAVQQGKHVNCEKPLTLSIAEGRLLADAARAKNVIFRTDTECRCDAYMIKIAELARNGYLGTIRSVKVGVPTGDKSGGNATPTVIPVGLDYELWTGSASLLPYCVDRVHPVKSYGRPGWMRCRNTCEGMITNWGTHLLDVAQLALNTERTGPISVEGTGTYPASGSGLWDVLLNFKAHFKYANGVTLDYQTAKNAYLRIEGDEGWAVSNWLSKEGFMASRPELLKMKLKDKDVRFSTRSDKKEFLHGIMTGEPIGPDAEVGHRTCSMGQIAHIAIQRGERLDWNPQTERFAQEAANGRLVRTYRAPWTLDYCVNTLKTK